jgi:hypothetical protein
MTPGFRRLNLPRRERQWVVLALLDVLDGNAPSVQPEVKGEIRPGEAKSLQPGDLRRRMVELAGETQEKPGSDSTPTAVLAGYLPAHRTMINGSTLLRGFGCHGA